MKSMIIYIDDHDKYRLVEVEYLFPAMPLVWLIKSWDCFFTTISNPYIEIARRLLIVPVGLLFIILRLIAMSYWLLVSCTVTPGIGKDALERFSTFCRHGIDEY